MKNHLKTNNFEVETSFSTTSRNVTIKAKTECSFPNVQSVPGQQKLHQQLRPIIRKEFNYVKNICNNKEHLSDSNKEEVLNFMTFTASTMLALHYPSMKFTNVSANAMTFDVCYSGTFVICTNTKKPIPILNICSLHYEKGYLYIVAEFKMNNFSDEHIEDFAKHITNHDLETFNPFPYFTTINTKGA